MAMVSRSLNSLMMVILPCAEAVNLYGDARDEIVTWDYDSMYIYTQDDAPKDDVYAPFKYPDYNASNYRGEYSYRGSGGKIKTIND